VSAEVHIDRLVVSGATDAEALRRALPSELARALGDLDIDAPAEVPSVSMWLPAPNAAPGAVADAVATAISRTEAGR
jgi:hypothetical protein